MARYRILVVDNSPVLLKLVSTLLREAGHEICTACNGLEAYDLLPRFQPDIVITDLIMPEIDGIGLCRLVRHNPSYANLFLIVLSGIAMEDMSHLASTTADICIAKGPAATMRHHLLEAIACHERGEHPGQALWNTEGLWSREVTQELLAQRRHADVILAGIQEGVVELNRAGRILRINGGGTRMLGCTDIDALASLFSSHLNADDARELEDWLASQPQGEGSSIYRRGEERPLRLGKRLLCLTLVPVQEADAVGSLIGIFRDITDKIRADEDRRQLEEFLRQNQRLEAMSRMAGGLAHDFNNLLTVLSGNIEIARLEAPAGSPVLAPLDEADRALRMAIQLMRKISDSSDMVAVNRQSVSLPDLLRDLLVIALPKGKIDCTFSAEEDLWPVAVDTEHISQIFGNILQNAREAMDQQGSLIVRMHNVTGENERRRSTCAVPDGPYVRISITDTGPGIALDILDRVFDPYFSTKQRGTQKGMGLGLTIVHSLVRQHGGAVWLEKPVGGGCTVHVYLPATGNQTVLTTSSAQPPQRILVMDDEEMLRNLAEKMLKRLGCDVSLACRGEDVLQLAAEARSQQRPYAAVILDLNVEDGMDGLTTAHRLRDMGFTGKLILSSGDPTQEIMQNPRRAGFDAVLPKPYTVDTMRDLLHKL